jgi:phosphoglycerate dehydrogenase-like enzyme
MFKAAILDDYQQVATGLADWAKCPGLCVHSFPFHFSSEAHLVDCLRPYHIIVLMRERTRFTSSIIAQLSANLELLITTGMRNSAIDYKACREHSIQVAGTRSSSVPPAELTWALLLALARHVPLEAHNMRTCGQWMNTDACAIFLQILLIGFIYTGPWQSTLGMELAGKTLGILGTLIFQ